MQTLGSIEAVKKMACPHCHNLLDEEDIQQALEGQAVYCPYCRKPIKLPEEMIARYQRSKYVGRTLDITC